MAFRLPNAARDWFRELQRRGSGFELDFDCYYFCLIAGITTGKKASLPAQDSTEIIQQFPKEYLPNHYLIIALFLHEELRKHGISLTEREALNSYLRKLVSPLSPTRLSDEGIREFNRYVAGGFRELQAFFPNRPHTLDAFLVEFDQFLQVNDYQ